MKKQFCSVLVGLATTFFAFSQATLPATCDFTGSQLPSVGWTGNPENYYTASGNPAPAFKFQYTGTNLVINVASAPGVMTFDIAGNSLGGNSSFEVQESDDGNTYTTVDTYNASNISTDGTYGPKSVQLAQGTRFIKFIYVIKGSGNIGLDNVNIQPAPVTQQQMEVLVNGNQTANNAFYTVSADVNDDAILPFEIKNNGSVETLVVSNVAISGTNADQFSFNNTPSLPLNILPLTSENIGIKFSPTSAGTKNATITITSNDIDFPTFSFDVIGYGDNLATEPAAQPTGLNFSDVKTYRMIGTFTPVSNTDGYLVLRKKGNAVTEVPVDGVAYTAGDVIGNAKVMKSSANSTFVPNDIIAGTDYHYAIFAYNGIGSGTNYLTTSPLIGNQTTPTDMIPTADYASITTSSGTFVQDLHALISPHTQHYYSDYSVKMVENFYARDTTNGKKVVKCQYTGKNYLYDYPFSFTAAGMSREHIYASSWFPIQSDQDNFYSDYHNLLLLNQNEANAIRSNYPFGEVVSDTLQHIGKSVVGKNAAGDWVYEPADETKGIVARGLFYMSLRYTENGTIWKLPSHISQSIPYGQDQVVLKKWNEDFPPTNLEIARNDFIDSLQKNRNPFIDRPEYACFIDFLTMNHLPNGCELGINEINALEENVLLYPNPSKDLIYIEVKDTKIKSLKVKDLTGKIMEKSTPGKEKITIPVSTYSSGIYFIDIQTEKGNITKKVIIP